MKIPKTINSYCPRCRTHTEHSLSLYKKGRERKLAQGVRRFQRKKAGYGSHPKPIQKRFYKVTKKQSIRLKCSKCGRITVREGMRLKKLEIV